MTINNDSWEFLIYGEIHYNWGGLRIFIYYNDDNTPNEEGF